MAGGNTTRRGYGRNHRRLRALLLPQAYGKLCPHCDEPMKRGEALDLDHTDDRAGYRGMAHARCNRRDGANKTNGAGATRAPLRTSENW